MTAVQYDNLAQDVKVIIDSFNDSKDAYLECKRIKGELEKIGYTCDYGLDGEITEVQKLKSNSAKYYIITGKIDGETEELYGSFDRSDCKYELDNEREGWKAEGYKSLKITSKTVESDPDPKVYDNLITSKELFKRHAPDFNFEHDEAELVSIGLERGFITEVREGLYLVNQDY